MKTVFVSWYERIALWARIGTVQAPSLKEADVYLRIIEKLRPTDTERRETNLKAVGSGYEWKPDLGSYGDKVIELEDEEAEALITGLENHPSPVFISEAAWIRRITNDLKQQAAVVTDDGTNSDLRSAGALDGRAVGSGV